MKLVQMLNGYSPLLPHPEAHEATVEADKVAQLGKFDKHDIGGVTHLVFENSRIVDYLSKSAVFIEPGIRNAKTDFTRYFPVEIIE